MVFQSLETFESFLVSTKEFLYFNVNKTSMVINSIDRWVDFENGSIIHLCCSLKFLHPSRKKIIDSPMVLASLRLTFPLSTFGIRYWPINLVGCLLFREREVKGSFCFSQGNGLIFLFFMYQLLWMVSFLHSVNSILFNI